MKYLYLLLLSLTACSPHVYRAMPIHLDCTDLKRNVQQALETESLCVGVYPDEAWWTFFQDPQLDRFIRISLEDHPDVKLAEARIGIAYYEALETRSLLFPQFNLEGNVLPHKLSGLASRDQHPHFIYGTQVTTYLTSVLYELDIWKKNRNTYYAALDRLFAERADYDEAKLLLSTSIASVYMNLQFHEKLCDLVAQRVQLLKEVCALESQRFDTGVANAFIVYQTDQIVQTLTDLLAQHQGWIDLDRRALAALVGNISCCEDAELTSAPSAIFDKPLPLPSTLPLDLLCRRPDLAANRWRVEAACFGVCVAKADFLPQIDLLGYIGFTSFKIDELFSKKALLWAGDFLGLLQLYTAQKLDAQLGKARELVELAIETYNQNLLSAIQEVGDALVHLTTSDARLGALQAVLSDAEALYQLTEQRVAQGIADQIVLLLEKDRLLEQEQAVVAMQLERFQSAVDLIRAIGGGYYDPE